MIFDQIIIENFGVYGGRQQANLRPEPDRPIVLFGGMNGGGKTTLLDAIQLALYGPKARLSNRGRLPYGDYLKDSIHRAADPGEGASITLRYRRHTDGEERSYELQRNWRVGVKGIEETLHVLRDGLPDPVLTDHWDESIAAYLPVRLAHLFFFDGEQIKDLAEGTHAAEIIGTAVEGLLGVDLLERLTLDLKGFERGQREEQHKNGQEDEASGQIRQAEGELAEIDRQLEAVAVAEGAKVNEANQLAKSLRDADERFKTAGGELYLRRTELNKHREALVGQRTAAEAVLSEGLAEILPPNPMTKGTHHAAHVSHKHCSPPLRLTHPCSIATEHGLYRGTPAARHDRYRNRSSANHIFLDNQFQGTRRCRGFFSAFRDS